MTYCLNKKSPISSQEPRLLQLLRKVLPCVTLPVVLKWSTTQVRLCRHAQPRPSSSRWCDPRAVSSSLWGNRMENKPAVQLNCS